MYESCTIIKDLVNWRIINYAVKWLPLPEYDTPQIGNGSWTPVIRYHNGLFYIYFSMPDDGIYCCYTDNPFGKRSDIVLVKKAKGWIVHDLSGITMSKLIL